MKTIVLALLIIFCSCIFCSCEPSRAKDYGQQWTNDSTDNSENIIIIWFLMN